MMYAERMERLYFRFPHFSRSFFRTLGIFHLYEILLSNSNLYRCNRKFYRICVRIFSRDSSFPSLSLSLSLRSSLPSIFVTLYNLAPGFFDSSLSHQSFIPRYSNEKRWCEEIVPDAPWKLQRRFSRARATNGKNAQTCISCIDDAKSAAQARWRNSRISR